MQPPSDSMASPTGDAANLADPAEDELRTLGSATAALGDRLAVAPAVTVLKTASIGTSEAQAGAGVVFQPVVDRRSLTDPTMIVERMARDILSARRDGQHGLLVDLTEYGWTQAQAMRWGTAAHEASRSPAVATQDAVERLAAREGRHLVTVASIDVDRVVAAGEAAVAAALGEIHDDFGGAAA